jgi:carboxymethylenebutenolidase
MAHTVAFRDEIHKSVERYRSGEFSRRELLGSLVALTGSYAAAHLFLETSGVAQSVISPREAQSANVEAERVRYRSGDAEIQAYLAKPKGGGKHPAVIVIHENRGLNEHIRDVARRFAAEGFAGLAPDLLSRAGGTGKMKTEAEATEAVGLLPLYGILDDLKAGFAYLETHPEADPRKISSVGFCWGGWRSFMLAAAEPKLYRAVVFYGASPESGYENIHAPVLAHYAKWDNRITGNALWTEEMMKKAGKKYQYYVYEKTDHAFFNDTGPRHNPQASALAWKRTLEFLRS